MVEHRSATPRGVRIGRYPCQARRLGTQMTFDDLINYTLDTLTARDPASSQPA